MQNLIINPITIEYLTQYGAIYAAAFSGEPWNDNWSVEDATIHVSELLESHQHYGLECIIDGEVAGFILGTSMLFHYGRTFEINDLADLKAQGIVGFHLITAREGELPTFYERFGFKKEDRVMLMGKE